MPNTLLVLVALGASLPAAPHHRHAAPAHHAVRAHHAAPHAAGRTRPVKAPPSEVEEIEQVEDVGGVEAVGTEAGGSEAKAGAADVDENGQPKLTFNAVLGHLHAAVVHLPIAWLALWSAFEALAIVWAHPWLLMSGLPMGIVSCLSFAPAVLTGLMRFNELAAASKSYDSGPAQLHRNLLFLSWALVVMACGMRLTVARPGRGAAVRTGYLVLVWLAFAITGWSAHLGGCMVYGDDFLPF